MSQQSFTFFKYFIDEKSTFWHFAVQCLTLLCICIVDTIFFFNWHWLTNDIIKITNRWNQEYHCSKFWKAVWCHSFPLTNKWKVIMSSSQYLVCKTQPLGGTRIYKLVYVCMSVWYHIVSHPIVNFRFGTYCSFSNAVTFIFHWMFIFSVSL